jgi:hypothetical protein
MSLWGASTTDESQPKYLTTVEKRDCYADERGWVYQDPNTGLEEVLVCIGGLNTSLGAATIIQSFIPTRANAASSFSINVVWNEAVTVTGDAPYIELGGTFTGSGNCIYTAGNNTSELQFLYTPVSGDSADTDLTIPDEITINTGAYINTTANLLATAAINLESSGYNNTTNVKPSLSGVTIVKA